MSKYPTAMQTAYCAGLFEGEGSVTAYRGCVRLSLTMTDKEPLEKMCVLGGRILGPYPQLKFPSRKALWQWRITGWKNAERIHKAFKSMLSPRRNAQFATVFASPRATPRVPVVRPKPCGFDRNRPSNSGHVAHYKRGEKACPDCYQAAKLYRQQLKERKSL